MHRRKLRQIIVAVTAIGLFFTLSGLFWLRADTQKGSTSSPHEKGGSKESSAEHPHPEGTKPHAAEEGKADEHSGGGEEAAGLKLTSEEKHNIGLKTVVADLRRLDSVIRMAGVVKSDPDREALLSSRVAGTILGVFARVGDAVKKGEKLAEIESVEIQKLQVDLIQAENRMLLTMAELGRIKKLVESKIAPRKELIAAENQHQAVLNEIDGLAQQLVLLGLPQEAVRRVRKEKSISTFALVSPIRGVVAERHVILGEMVEPDKVIFKILDLSVVLVEGDAFEEALPKLKIGQRVRIRLPAYPGELFTGKIIRVSPIIDPSKRTLRLWAVVPNRTGKLKPNLFAEMDVVVGDGGKVLAVPLEAIIRTEGKSIVLVEEKGSFLRADLILGAKDDRYIEVKKGLHFGDRVVIDGKQQLYTQSLMEQQGGAALGGHGH
ncbi:MAG: efflux RND transporter periplasmic adaptor subunit [Deltaproteobacteria bacterium]|nr:efflux RND transporter periplasmic adaptor subunit [Deltaproteobacteria bacterium]